jgi:hypothetical protein
MKNKNIVGKIIVGGIIVIIASRLLMSTIITENSYLIFSFLLFCCGVLLSYRIYTELYFRGSKFICIKESISKHINDCNELNHYIEKLKGTYVNIDSYNYGTANINDNSSYNFKRTEWNKSIKSNRIHHCSSTVCKNAADQPIKYLCKYFDIEKNEESLSKFEKVLNDFSSVKQGEKSIEREREAILNRTPIPFLINLISRKKFTRKLGFEKVDISKTYIPTFTFQYVSAGGNSSSNCEIKLTIKNLNHLINYLNDAIKWRKSIAGQRALMTSKLRTEIKERDNYQCCSCNLSTKDEPNLLLEIDHITPLSKGGMTTIDNLQTLCWKCNRSKGAKILS